MTDDQVTVGVAADIADFSAGMAQAGAVADETFGRIRTSCQRAADGMNASFGRGTDRLTRQQQKLAASWIAIFRPINAAFDRSIAGMILGTTTWRKAVARIGQSILAEEVGNALKLAENWVVTELVKTTATEEGAAARTAADQGAGATSLASLVLNAIKAITNDAAQTFAGVFAFLAPEMGPAAAAPAAAAQGEVMMAIAGLSAAGGIWDVPGTVLSVLHPEESVIPAAVANPMRDFFSGGAVAGAGGDIHIHGPLVSAIDTRTGALFLKANMRAIAKGLASELRNFNSSLTPALDG
ncbi:MAG: hypothetical protein KGL11_12790 [Alphaproteobacteria bacterium]|nr:hypothetical protein [Alphaproteobacteria bacterium]